MREKKEGKRAFGAERTGGARVVSFWELSLIEKRYVLNINAGYIRNPSNRRFVSLINTIRNALKEEPSIEGSMQLARRFSKGQYLYSATYTFRDSTATQFGYYDEREEELEQAEAARNSLANLVNPYEVSIVSGEDPHFNLRIS